MEIWHHIALLKRRLNQLKASSKDADSTIADFTPSGSDKPYRALRHHYHTEIAIAEEQIRFLEGLH